MPDNPQAAQQDVTPNVQQTPTATGRNLLREKFGDDWDAANQSYVNIVEQRQSTERDLNEAKQLLVEMTSRMNPSAQVERRSALDRLAEVGLPPDAIQEVVRAVVQESLQPLARGLQAREAILTEYPEFATEEASFQKFLKDAPNVRDKYTRMAGMDPEMAMEWGIAQFQRHKANTGTASNTDAAKSQATLPNSVQQSNRAGPTTGPDPEKMKQAIEYYRQTGDDGPLMVERLKGQTHPQLAQTR